MDLINAALNLGISAALALYLTYRSDQRAERIQRDHEEANAWIRSVLTEALQDTREALHHSTACIESITSAIERDADATLRLSAQIEAGICPYQRRTLPTTPPHPEHDS